MPETSCGVNPALKMKSVLSVETVRLEDSPINNENIKAFVRQLEQNMSNFNPSVHHQGVAAAVHIEQPCGVSPAVELILQTD